MRFSLTYMHFILYPLSCLIKSICRILVISTYLQSGKVWIQINWLLGTSRFASTLFPNIVIYCISDLVWHYHLSSCAYVNIISIPLRLLHCKIKFHFVDACE